MQVTRQTLRDDVSPRLSQWPRQVPEAGRKPAPRNRKELFRSNRAAQKKDGQDMIRGHMKVEQTFVQLCVRQGYLQHLSLLMDTG